MNVEDRRVKRTQRLLAKALIALTLEKGYDVVTIRDITERADVGYATFFRHYHDKDELLEDVLDVVLAEMLELLLPANGADPAAMGALIFRYVGEHSEVCRVLTGSMPLTRRLIGMATQSVRGDTLPQADSVVPPEIVAHHIVASSVALIQWWLEHDMPDPPERMGAIYAALIVQPTGATALSG